MYSSFLLEAGEFVLEIITVMELSQRTIKSVLFVNYASVYEEEFYQNCFQLFL